jgi:hypothetical protein
MWLDDIVSSGAGGAGGGGACAIVFNIYKILFS